jgi:hypothetical protein
LGRCRGEKPSRGMEAIHRTVWLTPVSERPTT